MHHLLICKANVTPENHCKSSPNQNDGRYQWDVPVIMKTNKKSHFIAFCSVKLTLMGVHQ